MEIIHHTKNICQAKKIPLADQGVPHLEAALAYAEAGIPVFPCKNKKPLTAKGFKDASCDVTLIRAWWTKHPDAELAMPTGEASGLWVLDVDFYKPEGKASLEELTKEHGALPKTLTARTGSGGLQFFFKHPGTHIKTVNGRPWKGIDVKGDGGYVVVPPSVRPDGGKYVWAEKAAAADAPDWLLEAVTSKQTRPRLSEPRSSKPQGPPENAEFHAGVGENWERIELEGVDEGERNDTLTRLAGYLLGTGVDPDEALERCLAFGGRCRPPMDEEEIERTFESIASAEAEKRTKIQDTVARLIEASATDKGAPFEPWALEFLATLKMQDFAWWERVREALKKNIRVGDLDKAVDATIKALRDGESKPARFAVRNGAICEIKATPFGEMCVELCNFDARIIRGEYRDDGAERKTILVIKAALADGTPLPEAKVPADKYELMRWVAESWAARAHIMPGRDTRDCLRAAIQILSERPPLNTIYTHLGWRHLEEYGWVYLHAGGAIGAGGPVNDVQVDPDGRLGDYRLPDPPDGDALIDAVRASIRTLGIAPAQITYPLLAAVYRAVLAEAEPVDLSIFLAGLTGAKKSSISGVFQAHFGSRFNDRHLPASWTSTANALERLAFLAKDALLTVDDFAPRGTVNNVNALHQLADRVLRGQGNLAGRDRMRADTSLRQGYAPRGLIIATGEDIPQGESLRARGLVLELGPNDVDLEKLTEAQISAAEGLLAQAMAGYVRWLAPRMDNLKQSLHTRFLELRTEARKAGLSHDRTPGIIANLALGMEHFLWFAKEVGAVTEEEAEALWKNCWEALTKAGREQGTFLRSEDPVLRFIDLISAAISSGRAHVADFETGQAPKSDDPQRWGWRSEAPALVLSPLYRPLGNRIGWLAGGELWLDPDAAFAEAQDLARKQGTALPVTQATLWKRMLDRGLLVPERFGNETRFKTRRVVEGKRRRVIVTSLTTQRDFPVDSTAVRESCGPEWPGEKPRPGHGYGEKNVVIPIGSVSHGPDGPDGPEKNRCLIGGRNISPSLNTTISFSPIEPSTPTDPGHPGHPGHRQAKVQQSQVVAKTLRGPEAKKTGPSPGHLRAIPGPSGAEHRATTKKGRSQAAGNLVPGTDEDKALLAEVRALVFDDENGGES